MIDPPLFFGHEIYRRSTYGPKHPLAIPRVSTVMDLCRALGWLPEAQFREAVAADPGDLARFHAPDYLAALQAAESAQAVSPEVRERYRIGGSGNPIYREMFRRPATGAGATIAAARLLAHGGIIYNPAGGTHHGKRDHASGFCYLNDPVLGLLAWLDLGLARILYVDIDAHHGDGVEEAFAGDERVFTLSIHEDGRWPGTGRLGDRAGGHARNLPVPTGLNDSEMDFLLEAVILRFVERLRPEAIMLQCGADALAEDPLSNLSLSNGAIWRVVAALRGAAPRLLVLGGGGYNPWSVGRCWTGVWATLNGHAIPERLPAAAEGVLRGLSYNRAAGRSPPTHWFTTLADASRPGPVRAELRAAAAAVLAG
ncbi:MAG: acetoin utilization protein AcuC [Alphaproteobacteria bacterium]|nr:acetoin utilization protein AcuC [Alphaproteobacteria bacterium]